MTYAESAGSKALTRALASETSAMKGSAPFDARGCKWTEFLPTTRTFCPRVRRLVATTWPVWPLAPSTTYIQLTSMPGLDAGGRGWDSGSDDGIVPRFCDRTFAGNDRYLKPGLSPDSPVATIPEATCCRLDRFCVMRRKQAGPGWVLLGLDKEHITFCQPAFLGHLVAVIE